MFSYCLKRKTVPQKKKAGDVVSAPAFKAVSDLETRNPPWQANCIDNLTASAKRLLRQNVSR